MQRPHRQHLPHLPPLQHTTLGFGLLALAFLALAILVQPQTPVDTTLHVVFFIGAIISGLSAWYHQRSEGDH